MKKQIGAGAIVAYVNTFLNMFINVFLTPFIISHLGVSEYGVYKTISSFSAQLGIMSFGISTLITRYIVFFDTKNKKKEKENFLFMAYCITAFLSILIFVVGFGMYLLIDKLYSNSLTVSELFLAKRLFLFLIVNVVLSVVCDSFTGLIRAHEKFVVCNGIATCRLVLRLLCIIALLSIGFKAMGIVISDALISLVVAVASYLYSRVFLQEKAKFHTWDWAMMKSCFMFSLAVFMQAIVNQANQNVDNIILGAMQGPTVVTVYSIGLSLYTAFNSFVTIVGGMYAPQATRLVANGANGEQLTDFAIRPARIQGMLACLGVVGFVLVGQDFIQVWMGTGYEDVYKITLILIIPVVLPLVESITNNILDALLKRMARSLILVGMCCVNITVSIILINAIGYTGAAYGTAFSLVVGHGILMNMYLYKKIHINVFRLFKSVFSRTLIVSVITLIVCWYIRALPTRLSWLVLKIVVIVAVYGVATFFIGLSKREKTYVVDTAKRLIKNFCDSLYRKKR